MALEQEGGRPPQGDFPPSQGRTKYIIHIPQEKAKGEHPSTRAEKVGNHRPLLGGNALGGGGKLKDISYAEGGGDNERSEDDLVIDWISVDHANRSE